MGPVEAILMGLRPVLRPRGRLPESLCRTLDEKGRERSSCVHCNSPCLDIDASKAYRTSLREERGLGAAWWSYPGLVLAFYLLLNPTSNSLNGVPQASWASAGATAPPWPQAVLGLSLGSRGACCSSGCCNAPGYRFTAPACWPPSVPSGSCSGFPIPASGYGEAGPVACSSCWWRW
jgi:hypothetical protein